MGMANDHDPTSSGNFAARLLEAFDLTSGYTILAIAVAGAVVLQLPSPIFGIDLGPIRIGIYGATIAAITILAGCLAIAKALRAAHEYAFTRSEMGRKRFVVIPSRTISFWQGNQLPNGPVLQLHIQATITNPNTARGLIPSSIRITRVTPFGIFFKRECLNFSIGGEARGPFELRAVGPRHTTMLQVDHFHPGRYPITERHLWICLEIIDQLNRRSRTIVRLRHVRDQR